MAEPTYTLVKEFKRIEAIGMRGARHGDLSDPIDLNIRVTEGTDISAVVESMTREEGRSTNRLRRLQRGSWAFELNPALLEAGKYYTVHWSFQMSPGNDNVVRSTFVWEPVPPVPSLGKTVIYGQLLNAASQPVPDTQLYLEEYRDYATLSRRLSQVTLTTDDFGIWWTELDHDKVVRFVLGEISQIVKTPSDKSRVALSELPTYQHTDIVRKDAYGYPLPSQEIFETVASQSSERDALALLSTDPIVRHLSICDDAANTTPSVGGGVTYEVYDQSTPSLTWTISHGSDCLPIVSVINDNSEVCFPDISYPDLNTVLVSFGVPSTGKALLLCKPGS